MENTEGVVSLATINYDDFAKVKLRVGEIRVAEVVPKSKKLLRLEVDLGPSIGTRQILAGIQQHYQPEVLLGRKIVVVANLEPAKLAGLESQGMLLAASNADNSKLSLIDPGDIEAGSEVR